ncbi:hypothetical protein FNV43_RR18377 [Rhamnella rubrinervis]|uniref:Pentatricopeptide repeat-containing protein n=1 Tax=Rhamnella rubrinervis TaxID=2594499 RepID=A0A8K0E5Q7_9ROSA|nr:hypothetical protein FNV43_RR18377 [Rhamnella rubrinervis]
MVRNALQTNLNLLSKFIVTCASVHLIRHARRVFDHRPHGEDSFLCNSMIKAHFAFDEMPLKDSAAYNVMIDGYVKSGIMGSARNLFEEMKGRNVATTAFEPDEVTIVSILPAIADLGALDLGSWVHQFVKRKKLDKVISVCTALVDMYAKCGEITKAKRIFHEMPEKETAPWNALIYGLAVNGCGKEALDMFLEMQQTKFKPDGITMLSVLSACNHSGLVEEGKKWFKEMENFKLVPQIEHYGCMIDLLGRSGCLEEAEKLISSMPYKANEIILSSFLFACGYSEDVTRAKKVLSDAIKLDPGNAGNYVAVRNLYAAERRWNDVEEIKGLMKKNGSNKEVGCSFIEVDGVIREFVAGNTLHPCWGSMHLTLEQFWKHMKGEIICNKRVDCF